MQNAQVFIVESIWKRETVNEFNKKWNKKGGQNELGNEGGTSRAIFIRNSKSIPYSHDMYVSLWNDLGSKFNYLAQSLLTALFNSLIGHVTSIGVHLTKAESSYMRLKAIFWLTNYYFCMLTIINL